MSRALRPRCPGCGFRAKLLLRDDGRNRACLGCVRYERSERRRRGLDLLRAPILSTKTAISAGTPLSLQDAEVRAVREWKEAERAALFDAPARRVAEAIEKQVLERSLERSALLPAILGMAITKLPPEPFFLVPNEQRADWEKALGFPLPPSFTPPQGGPFA